MNLTNFHLYGVLTLLFYNNRHVASFNVRPRAPKRDFHSPLNQNVTLPIRPRAEKNHCFTPIVILGVLTLGLELRSAIFTHLSIRMVGLLHFTASMPMVSLNWSSYRLSAPGRNAIYRNIFRKQQKGSFRNRPYIYIYIYVVLRLT